MRTNNTETCKDAIKAGLKAFYEMAYMKAYRGSWYKRLARPYQLQAGRAIFLLRDAAAHPEKYFGPGQKDISDIDAAFWADYRLRARLNGFCEVIRSWYKKTSSLEPYPYALVANEEKLIFEKSRRICTDFIIERDGYAVFYINKLFDSSAMRRVFLGERQNTK